MRILRPNMDLKAGNGVVSDVRDFELSIKCIWEPQ